MTKVIGTCPRDGREWDCQCARCGSSMEFVECDYCGGDGFVEDDDWESDGEMLPCHTCRATGGHWACIASRDWCEAHPNEGRAETKRGTVEWFTFQELAVQAPGRAGRA